MTDIDKEQGPAHSAEIIRPCTTDEILYGLIPRIVWCEVTLKDILKRLERLEHPLLWRCSGCKAIMEESKAYWHMQKCEKRQERLKDANVTDVRL